MTGLAIRMTLRNWRRLVLASLGLAVALLLFAYYQVMVSGLVKTATALSTKRLYSGDIVVVCPGGVYPGFVEETIKRPGVTDVFPIEEQRVSTDVGDASLLVMDASFPDLNLKDTLLQGRLPAQTGEVCVDDAIAKEHNLAIGSQIDVSGDAQRKLSVVGILDSSRQMPRSLDSNRITLIGHGTPASINFCIVYVVPQGVQANTYILSQQLKPLGGFAVAPNASADSNDAVPTPMTEGLVRIMSVFIVLAVGGFLCNMLMVGMLSRQREYDALHALGVPKEQVLSLPLSDAMFAGIMAMPLVVLGWILVLPRIIPSGTQYTSALRPPLLVSAMLLGMLTSMAAGCLAWQVSYKGRAS